MLYIFDLDGTLRVTKSGRPCPNEPDDQELLPGVKKKLKELNSIELNCLTFCSNQGGVSLGYMTKETSEEVNKETECLLGFEFYLGVVSYWHEAAGKSPEYFETFYPKPSPQMLQCIIFRYLKKYPWKETKNACFLHNDEALFVGDAFSDRDCARNAKVRFEWAHDFFGFEAEETEFGFSYVPWLKKWKEKRWESKATS